MIVPMIYGLVDPRDGMVYYVGRSERSWAATLGRHLDNALLPWSEGSKSKKCAWIRDAVASGNEPTIVRLADTTTEACTEDEKFWIAQFRAINTNLTNGNKGGGRAIPYSSGPWARHAEWRAERRAAAIADA